MNALHPLGAAAALVAALVFGTQTGTTRPVAAPSAAATYEHLAAAIIAIRETETSLVRDMLTVSYTAAVMHLDAAADPAGAGRRMHLESAAGAITEIATEGDKQVQAVRQRLLRAGHHHHTDAETEADYIFVDGREKKALLDIAGKVARLSPTATRQDIASIRNALRDLFARAMAPE